MPSPPQSVLVRAAHRRLEAELRKCSSALNGAGCFAFYRCLFAAHGRGHYLFLGSVKFFTDCLGVASPFLLKLFLDWLQSSDAGAAEGGLYAGLMAGVALLGALITPHYNYQISCLALNVRSSIMVSVFQRCALHQPQQLAATNHDSSATNLINIDSQRVADTVSSFNELWSLPVQVALAFYLLYCQVGWSFLAGVAFMLLLLPVNMSLAKTIQRSTARLSAHRDGRIEKMRRLLKGMRTIKSFSLEGHTVNDVRATRSLEFAQLRRRKLADSGCVLFWAVTPVAVVLATVSTYYWMNAESELTTGQLFSAITLLNMLVYPFNAFPWVINGIMEARVSATRLQKFIANIPISITHKDDFGLKNGAGDCAQGLLSPQSEFSNGNSPSHSSQLSSCISFSNLVIAACPTLHRVSERVFTIGPMSLQLTAPHILAVVGPVSSGKSVFMRALAGECAVASGAFSIPVASSYSSQEPFLYDAPVVDNIVFGSKLNSKILNEVAAACGIDRDAKSWAGGLSYVVGPGGRRCSSGQRMRISAARALYRSKISRSRSICILDGPTTGLDDALVRTVLESLAKHAQQGCIVCISFASLQHLKILMDSHACSVTVISLQQHGALQVLSGPALVDMGSLPPLPHSEQASESSQQRDGEENNQEHVPEEHREFGGLRNDS
jgi:ATP-binding cassette subfamily C (CFTR/MRP) protein 10